MIENGTWPQLRQKHWNSFERTFGTTTVLPGEFILDRGLAKFDQNAMGMPNGCTGCTQAYRAGNHDKSCYNASFTYQKTLLIENHAGQDVGCLITNSLKSTEVFGVKTDSENEQDALTHRRGQPFDVDVLPGQDYFDAIRSAIITRKVQLSAGTIWYNVWEPIGNGEGKLGPDAILAMPSQLKISGPWHNYVICDFVQKNSKGEWIRNGETFLRVYSHQGAFYGDKGYVYMDRNVCNAIFGIYGTQLFVDDVAGPNDIVSVKRTLIEVLLDFLERELGWKLAQFPVNTPAPTPPPAPVEPPPAIANGALLWDTPENVRHSIRVICDQEGLTVEQKNILTATLQCESGFNPKTVHPNIDPKSGKVFSTDYGVCQWNDYYHGKEISPEEAVSNPEKAVRLMCSYVKKGQIKQWVCYSAGLYKKYL